MIDILAAILILIGATFALVAGIGVVRLPDLYVRMHAATKAGTLGAGAILIAIALISLEFDVILRAIAGIIFLVATAPIAGHLLGRSAYITGVPLWPKTKRDDLSGQYDTASKRLEGLRDGAGDTETP
jgi:multicomponent Na+:H+ antiporter subunit G